jgi:hypothetical protein
LVEPARDGGSYVLQRVLCGKSSLGIELTSGAGGKRGDRLRGARAATGKDPGELGGEILIIEIASLLLNPIFS